MNSPTHVILGMVVAGLFFGDQEMIPLVGLGSEVPKDLKMVRDWVRPNTFVLEAA